jgi:dihydrofolate reductase
MKLTTTFVSFDGVMQGIGGRDEDPSGGFERGGWTVPHFDNETAMFVSQIYRHADAFLLGRRTYEIFAGSWGAMADSRSRPNAAPFSTPIATPTRYERWRTTRNILRK